jgi:hypothetical protein
MKAFGMSDAKIAAMGVKEKGPDDERRLEIEPENEAAVQIFLRLQTQWRLVQLSTGKASALLPTGLDYAALPTVARALRFRLDRDTLDRIGILEDESLRIRGRRVKDALKRR